MRCLALMLVALPAAAAPLPADTPHLSVRLEGVFGQPTTQMGVRGGGGLGVGWRVSEQVWLIGDVSQRAAPGGGIGAIAAGLQAAFDMTPIVPYLELTVARMTNQEALGYSLATRIGLGADWFFSPRFGLGLVVRTYTPFDPEGNNAALAGTEAALRFIITPGAKP